MRIYTNGYQERSDNVAWTTSNSQVITVDQAGQVTAIAPGQQVTVTAAAARAKSSVTNHRCNCRSKR